MAVKDVAAAVFQVWFGVALVFFDQIAKLAVLKRLHQNESIPVIPNILHITLVYNTGSAFGLFRHKNWILAYISIAAIVLILWLLIRRTEFHRPLHLHIWRYSLLLVLSGATGNLIDRVRWGYVVDFLDFRVWPVFNLADSLITCGAAGLVYLLCRKHTFA
ncbi:MAG: signal peptidase II [Candidatus Omnitrophica bacterium]|nr:signal peptidase II [Candidatus Omnitrophota bacterium]